jgi:hypothetical protein
MPPTDSSNDIRDVRASILIYLTEVADNLTEATTIDRLTADFASSGYETKREWVVTAVNQLLVDGDIEGTIDNSPSALVRPSLSFIQRHKLRAAVNQFPSDKTCIERIPWQAPEPGAPSYSKPIWRLVVWGKGTDGQTMTITDVVESDKLGQLLSMVPWLVVWHAKVINEAIKAIGKLSVDGSQDNARDGSTWKLRVYSDCIRVRHTVTDEIMDFSPAALKWSKL